MIGTNSKTRVKGSLALRLKSGRDIFVRSESIDIEVSVRNNSSTSFEIEDLTALNDPLRFHAINNLKTRFSGSLLGSLAKDGTEVPSPLSTDLITLKPRETKTVNVDLVNILGELPEANYRIKATYQSKGILHLGSNILNIQILKSRPIYSSTYQDYLRLVDNPIRSAWINKEEHRFCLFVTENSPNYPPNLRSNRRILRLEKPCGVLLSVLESYGQDVEDLVWSEGDIVQRIIVHKRLFKRKEEIRLPILRFQLLGPLLTDEDGKLHFAVLSREDDSTIFHLVGCPLEGNIETSEICRFRGEVERCCVIFDAELMIHIAWASRVGDIYYIHQEPEEGFEKKGEAEPLVSSKTPLLDLQLSSAYFDEEGNRQLILHFLNEESEGKLCSHTLNVETKRRILDSFFLIPETKEMELLQAALDLECQAHFLFRDDVGGLWFKSFKGSEPVKVAGEGETHPGNIDCPVLLVSSDLSRHYGIYLRYIKDGSHLVCKKLESLI